jgi:hypothetical protein
LKVQLFLGAPYYQGLADLAWFAGLPVFHFLPHLIPAKDLVVV